ncbi:MAG: hypothetical protein NW202_13445 [Nitrospira sp.]|nr:hypothetical protein [Nitrospira sp.]
MSKLDLYDGDDETADADKRAEEKVRERAAALEKQASPEGIDEDLGRSPPVVDLSEEEHDEPSKPSRDERRANRFRELQEERDALARQKLELEHALSLSQRRQVHEEPQSKRNPDVERIDAELQDVFTQEEILLREIRAKADSMTPEQMERYRKQGREIEIKKGTLINRRARAESAEEDRRQMADAAVQSQLYSKYKDVLDNQDARTYAEGLIRVKSVTERGRKTLDEITEDAMAETRRVVLRQARPTRTPSERSRFDGGPKAAGGSGPDTGPVTQVVMHKAFRRMANEAFPHIKDENERYKRWAKGPGARVMKEESRKSRLGG